jgi:hypothetical protein
MGRRKWSLSKSVTVIDGQENDTKLIS